MRKTTNDHRIKVTKMLIKKSFTELLKKKPIQNITIRELCENAGINRGTFYTHYTDIYDLLQQMEDEILVEFEKALQPLLESTNDFNPVEIINEIFIVIKDNSDMCSIILSDNGDKSFATKLINLGREKCIETYLKYFKKATPKQIEYFYVFVSSGCIGILRKWIEDGLIASSDEIARATEKIIMQGIGFLETKLD